MLRVLDLFSGIGGFSLGLERAGMRTVAFCEIDPYCRRVLAKHWPKVPIYDDVRTLTADRLAADGIGVDLICGGFPCQDISFAGNGAGLAGERSGLWSEYARLVGELRPRFVIVENVAALLSRGLDTVLADLAALRFDAEWHCIPAAAVGAPHHRDRIWIVAYAQYLGPHVSAIVRGICSRAQGGGLQQSEGLGGVSHFSDTDCDGCQRCTECDLRAQGGIIPPCGDDTLRCCAAAAWCRGWLVEPDVGRVAHGVPARVDRLRGLGNAVVPQIPELIGRAILSAPR